MTIFKRWGVISLFAIVLVPLFLFSGYMYMLMEKSVHQAEYQSMESIIQIQENRILGVLNHYQDVVRLVGSRTNLRRQLYELQNGNDASQEQLFAILDDVLKVGDGIKRIDLLSEEKRILLSTQLAYTGELSYWHERSFNKAQYEVVDFIRNDDDFSLVLSYPLFWEQEFVGYLLLEKSGSKLLDTTSDYTGLGNTGETTLAASKPESESFTSLTRLRFKSSSLMNTGNFEKSNSPIVNAFKSEEGLIWDDLNDYRGKTVYASTRRFERDGFIWAMLVKKDVNEINQQLERTTLVLVLSLTFISLFMLVVLCQLSKRYKFFT